VALKKIAHLEKGELPSCSPPPRKNPSNHKTFERTDLLEGRVLLLPYQGREKTPFFPSGKEMYTLCLGNPERFYSWGGGVDDVNSTILDKKSAREGLIRQKVLDTCCTENGHERVFFPRTEGKKKRFGGG